MDIIQKITKDQTLEGVVLSDNGEVYPVRLKGLHNPYIFNALMDSGWTLKSFPYGFEKDGEGIADLNGIEWSAASFTDQELQDLEDIDADVLPKEVIMKSVTAPEECAISFEPSLNFIKTRAELLDFLNNTKIRRFGTPVDYLPLNSFVSKSALFTPSEYFAPENAVYRELIENRRVLEFEDFKRLVEFLQAHNLPSNYSTIDLVDSYFQWGICGLKFTVLEKHKEFSMYKVSSTLEDQGDISRDATLRITVPTYLDAFGTVYRPESARRPEWHPESSEKRIAARAKALRSLGDDYIAPERLVGPARDVNWVIEGPELSVTYDDTCIKISRMVRGMEKASVSTAIAVRKIGGRGTIQNKYLVGGDLLYTDILLTELSKDLLKRSLENSDASSYDAVKTLGVTDEGAAHFLFGKESVANSILADLNEREGSIAKSSKTDVLEAIEQYLSGTLDTASKLYNSISDAWEDIVSGNLNVDAVLDGQQLDWQRDGEAEFKAYLRLAHSVLKLSLDDIRTAVESVTKSTPFLELEGNGKRIRIDLPIVSERENGYKLDVEDYRTEQAASASSFGFIKSAWLEMGGPTNQKRHIGFEMYLLDLSGRKRARLIPVRDYLFGVIKTEIEENVPYSDQQYYINQIPLMIANQYFSILLKNEILIPKPLGGAVITPPSWVREIINNESELIVDSTYNLANITVSSSGALIFYCVNAVVLPDYIVPRRGFKIRELSIVPMWFNTVGVDVLHDRWLKRGFFTDPSFRGFEQYGLSHHLPLASMTIDGREVPYYDPKKDPNGLYRYFMGAQEYLKSYPLDKELLPPPHPADAAKSLDSLDVSLPDRVTGSATERHAWYIGEACEITHDDVVIRDPRLMHIWKRENNNVLESGHIKPFFGFPSEQLLFLDSLESVFKALTFDGEKIYAYGLQSDDSIKIGTAEFTYDQIPGLYETGKFQINKVSGNFYLIRGERPEDIFEVSI